MDEKLSSKNAALLGTETSRARISRRALLKAAGTAAAGAAVGGGLTGVTWAYERPINLPALAANGGILPLVPIRDKVYFPSMVFPLFVGRERSVAAIAEAQAHDGYLLLVAQKEMTVDQPQSKDVYQIGTVAQVREALHLPDGTVRVMVAGAARARVLEYLALDPFHSVRVGVLPEAEDRSAAAEAEVRAVAARFQQLTAESRNIPQDALFQVASVSEPGRLADTITPYLPVPVAAQQEILETIAPRERLQRLRVLLG